MSESRLILAQILAKKLSESNAIGRLFSGIAMNRRKYSKMIKENVSNYDEASLQIFGFRIFVIFIIFIMLIIALFI